MWGPYLALLGAFVAVAAIVAVSVWAHSRAAGDIYGAALGNQTAVATLDSATDLVREGARWAHGVHCEATVWAIVLTVLAVIVLGYNFWTERLFGR